MSLFKQRSEREKYDSTAKELKDKKAYAEMGPMFNSPVSQALQPVFEISYHNAKRKLKNLYNKQHSEAIKLNNQYDALTTKLRKDAQEVYEFEKKKLGMHREGKESKLAAVASIITFVAGIFFLSPPPSMSGNIIGLNSTALNWTSAILLGIAMISGILFFYFRKK